ncbi:type IV secretion system protein [Rhizobium terrae]|uniref:type IV secretion system protein n=1 Tax=Rhizobium terrae TaxID=2171756 RepID=UPI0013C37142|nr:type IV secretion system protein [Rhizobium terrae]
MRRILTLTLICGIALFEPVGGLVTVAQAQSPITPLEEPIIGTVPSKPVSAQQAYDQVSIEQLMKITELSRTIGGGVSQLFTALVGTRKVPMFNGPAEVTAREGGPGLKAMAYGFIKGEFDGPDGVRKFVEDYSKTYGLDELLSSEADEISVASAKTSAQGVISASIAEESYQRANASMARINDYLKTLETSADLKTSVDLNTRVMIELTQQVNENIRTQAAVASATGIALLRLGGASR